MGMVGPKYVWLLPATTTGAWIFSPSTFRRFYPGTDCNVSQIVEAADGFIASDKVPIRQDNNETLSGLVSYTFDILIQTGSPHSDVARVGGARAQHLLEKYWGPLEKF
jgi:hypothetical protein